MYGRLDGRLLFLCCRVDPDGAGCTRWAGSQRRASLKKSPTSGSSRRVGLKTVSLTSQVSCRQGSKTTFS